jgi:hypothetical protein
MAFLKQEYEMRFASLESQDCVGVLAESFSFIE